MQGSSSTRGGRRGGRRDDRGRGRGRGGGRGGGRNGGDGRKRRAYEGDGGRDEEFANFFGPSNGNGSVRCVFLDVSMWHKQPENSIELKKLEPRRIQSRVNSF